MQYAPSAALERDRSLNVERSLGAVLLCTAELPSAGGRRSAPCGPIRIPAPPSQRRVQPFCATPPRTTSLGCLCAVSPTLDESLLSAQLLQRQGRRPAALDLFSPTAWSFTHRTAPLLLASARLECDAELKLPAASTSIPEGGTDPRLRFWTAGGGTDGRGQVPRPVYCQWRALRQDHRAGSIGGERLHGAGKVVCRDASSENTGKLGPDADSDG